MFLCMTVLFALLQSIKSDITQGKLAVSLVIEDSHFNLLQGLMIVNMLTVHSQGIYRLLKRHSQWFNTCIDVIV